MQLRKFYGRSMAGTLARVRQALGADALILETREIAPGSPAERLNPGARYEVIAAKEAPGIDPARPAQAAFPNPARGGVLRPMSGSPAPNPMQAKADELRQKLAAMNGEREPQTGNREPVVTTREPGRNSAPVPRYALLADLAELKAQLNDLMDGSDPARPALAPGQPGLDLADYHALIKLGVEHRVLAPHFRSWLQWRTAPANLKRYIAGQPGSPAPQMRGVSLHEWLLHAWTGQSHPALLASLTGQAVGEAGPTIVGLLGATGVGKTTTLAKLSSIFRQSSRQKSVIVTLDTQRFGATEQWRKISKLMDVQVDEIVSPEDLTRSMESWSQFGWIGIDTPGGMNPESPKGKAYGRLLADCPLLQTVVVVPATQHADLSREQMRMTRPMGSPQVIYSKLDEARGLSGALGNLVNLSLGEQIGVAGLTTGTRVPEDFTPATADALWRNVLGPAAVGVAA